jgi:hypothetical protein
MAGVCADVSRRSGEEEGEPTDVEQEMVDDPAQHGAGSVPAGDSAANIPEGHNGSRGKRPENVNNEIRDQSEASHNAGGRAVRIVLLSRTAGAETTAVVRTTVRQKLGRGPS